MSATEKKIYVIDTNVLILDPLAVINFEEHDVCIPFAVLEELDKIKQEDSDRGRQARQATRVIDKIMDQAKDFTEKSERSIDFNDIHIDSITPPTGKLFFESLNTKHKQDIGADLSIKDNQIVLTALNVKELNGHTSVIVVTNDTNMRVKSQHFGLKAESYRNEDVLTDDKTIFKGFVEYNNGDFWELFSEVATLDSHPDAYAVRGDVVTEWNPGMYIAATNRDETLRFRVHSVTPESSSAVLIIQKNYFNSNRVFGLNARTEEQNFAMNALMDPDVDLVTLAGPAGSGKTLLAIAAGLELAYDKEAPYEKVIVTRETIEIGEKIGFLPGSEEEKMAPWMQAFNDNIETLIDQDDKLGAVLTEEFLKKRFMMRSLGLMRGRSLRNTILIIDEAQNTRAKQIKALLTRAGENTKVVLMGNVAQIDSAYLNAGSTGLANAAIKFQDWPFSSHVTLDKVERSRLAEAAEERL